MRAARGFDPLSIETSPLLAGTGTHAQVVWRLEPAPAAALLPDLRQLWPLDQLASPFAGPAFLQSCADDARAQGAKVVFVRGVSENRTVALWPFMIDRGGVLRFLQGEHVDHCTCLATPRVDPDQLATGLARVLRELQPAAVAFKNVPPWGPTLAAIKAGLAQSGWPARAFAGTACPVMKTEPGPRAVEMFLLDVNRHKRVRNYENRLTRLPGYAFEAVRHANDLESWADEFCNVHEWRWNRTDTPSEYRHTSARERFLRQLTAWSEDGTLCRFSIRTGDRRIALAVGLLGGGRLVYHRPATAPGWSELRPGHVLIRRIGLWMADLGLHVLDFGVGDEDYKSRYAQHDDRLWRVYAARRRLSMSLAYGLAEERIRETPAALQLWDHWVNRMVRGKLRSVAGNAWDRLRLRRRNWYSGIAGTSVAGGRHRREILYRAFGGGPSGERPFVSLRTSEALKLMNGGTRLPPADRAGVIERVYAGARLRGFFESDRLVAAAWLLEEPALSELEPGHQVCYRVEPCALTTAARRPGVLARFFEGVRADVPSGAPVFVSVARSSAAPRKALARAGFEAIAARTVDRRSGAVTLARLTPSSERPA